MVANESLQVSQLTGRNEDHIVDIEQMQCRVHRSVERPLRELAEAAERNGFVLAVASGYRGYARQCQLWNDKVEGRRPVLDGDGRPLDLASFDDWRKVQAILRWSALPGASRHHWGTEVDVFDAAAMPEGYQLQLTVAETQAGGVFDRFHRWLDRQLAGPASFGFFRPYAIDSGGVAPEPWHLSYAPLARRCQKVVTQAVIEEVVKESTLLLKEVVLRHLDEIYQRYVWVPEQRYPAAES